MKLVKVPLLERHLNIDTYAGRFLLMELIYPVELPRAVNIAIETMLHPVLYGLGLIGMLINYHIDSEHHSHSEFGVMKLL